MWDISSQSTFTLAQTHTDCAAHCSPPRIQSSQAQAAAAKPGLSCFLLWYPLLCTSQSIFGRVFCGVWLVWKACSQRTLDTKYLLCWHLFYKLLAPVKIIQLKLFGQNTQNCLYSSTIRNLLSNPSFFHQKSSFVLIYCEIEQNSTGRKTDLSVLGIQQSNHELVYWIVKKETILLGRWIYHTSGITTYFLDSSQTGHTLSKNSPL